MATSSKKKSYKKSKATKKPVSNHHTTDTMSQRTSASTTRSGRSYASAASKLRDTTPIRNETKNPAKFTLYPKLPLEIRFKVIQYAIPHFPRVLEVQKLGTDDDRYRVVANCISPLLQVNGEIRGEVMKHYSAPFDFNSDKRALMSDLKVNWDIDTLFIRSITGLELHFGRGGFEWLWAELFGQYVPDMKSKIRKLAGWANDKLLGMDQEPGSLKLLYGIGRSSPLGFARLKVFDDLVNLEKVGVVRGPVPLDRFCFNFDREDSDWLEKGFNHNRGSKKVAVIRMTLSDLWSNKVDRC